MGAVSFTVMPRTGGVGSWQKPNGAVWTRTSNLGFTEQTHALADYSEFLRRDCNIHFVHTSIPAYLLMYFYKNFHDPTAFALQKTWMLCKSMIS